MTVFLEKKKLAYLTLLEISEEMKVLVQMDDLESISEVICRRNDVIQKITDLDKENEYMVDGARPAEIHELLALAAKISAVNESLTMTVSERIGVISNELRLMNKGANAAAQYAKIGAM